MRWGAFLGVLALGGCALGPDYQQPAVPADASGTLAAFNPATETEAPPPGDWWQLYHDPVLNHLLDEAFRANQDLRAADANLSSARAVLEAAQTEQFPTTRIASGGTYGRDAGTDEILELGGHKPESIWVVDALFSSSYEVDLFGRVRRTIEQKQADAGAVAAVRDEVRVAVAAETTRAYAEICTVGAEITVAQAGLDLASREASIVRARADAGAGSPLDVARAATATAAIRATIPPLEGRRAVAWYQLADLLGSTPQQAPPEVLACATAPRLAAPLPVGDGTALLRRRPDVRAAERSLAASTAGIGIATADLLPRISLSGSYGGISTDINLLDTNNALTWGVGPSMSWSFPNLAGPLARLKLAKSSNEATLDRFNAVVLGALKDTSQALASYDAELAHHHALTSYQADASHAFDLARGQYGAGAVSHLDLLTAQQTLIGANAQVAASDEALAQDQIAVFRALGGGWQ